MADIHRLMRDMPAPIFAIMVGLPLIMAAAALGVGWYARSNAGGPEANPASTRARANDPFYAGLTMALIPLAFALLMLWGRFG